MRRDVFIVALAATIPLSVTAQDLDLLIQGGRVIDGTGNPWMAADVGVKDGFIVETGRLNGMTAADTLDVTGRVVVPGFIDLHSHADGPNYGPRGLRSEDVRRRAAPNFVTQGITTVVVNHDGRSIWPIAQQLAELRERPVGVNVAALVGHGTVRAEVMGNDYQRVAAPDEVDAMRALVRQAMREGAWGMSSGLEYIPGRWSNTTEVLALVEELAPFGGVYITHERASGADPMWYLPSSAEKGVTYLDAVAETIDIAEATGVTSVQTHVKARGANYWGSSRAAIQLIERARARGVPIWADQYPYSTTGSDGSTVLIPGWARDDLTRILQHPDSVVLLHRDIAHEIERRGSAENIVIMEHPNPEFVGKTLAQLAATIDKTPADMAIQLAIEGYTDRPGGVGLRGFSLSEIDVEAYAAYPWVATATDGWISLPEDGLTHVRVYGAYPRKIAYYAMERAILSVEDAVRSSTSLPAQILGMSDRGLIREGMRADIVVLDLATLRDNATFFEPHQYASGVEHVLVNGEFVVRDSEITGELPGMVLSKN